ncbi:MAG: alpha-L-rhamnosidase, partial [Tannerellaceae bacterium]
MYIKLSFLLCVLCSLPLAAQQRDSRVREYLPPVRVVWQQDSARITGAHHLLLPGNGQTDQTNNAMCVMRAEGSSRPALLLDFGCELQGGLQLVTGMPTSQQPVRVRIRLGESVSEAMCEIDGQNGATNDHAMRDFTISLPWLGVTEVGNSGFRFVRIDLLDATELQLKELRAVSTFRDIPYKGTFRCSDERLNAIWQTGARTVHLNMQEYLWDGIKRDRLVWVGDMFPEVMTINSVFGYNEVVPRSLDFIRDATPLPGWMHGFSSYSIWWLLIHREWYNYQGDLVYLKEQQAYVSGLLRLLIGKVDAKGYEKLDGVRFLDWPSNGNPVAVDAGLQALLIQALRAGDELCTVLGDDALAKECRKTAARAVKAADKATRSVLNLSANPTAPGSKQAAALMVLSGLIAPKVANEKILSVGGGHGFSTFYGYYMLRAMATAGNYQGALDVIRTYWGAMLDLGATSFWEDFDLDWLPNAAPIDELVPVGKVDVHGAYGAYCY